MGNGWDEGVYVIHDKRRNVAVGQHHQLVLMQDPNRLLDRTLCNLSRPDGQVCRLLKGHDGLHVPFTGELISTTGMYVVAVEPLA